MLICSFVFGNPVNGSLEFDRAGWSYILILGIPCGAVMIYCWGKALQYTTPTQATLCMGFHPLTAMLLGFLMLEEQITLNFLIGFLLVFAGIFLVQMKPKIY
jgi:drug/metabolite transporter (DMT)-like permease